MTLSRRTTRALKWSFASTGARQVLNLATLAGLTRMLAPHDFGLLSMGLVVTGFVSLFNDLGTSAALIQRQDPSHRLLSTAFWLNVAIGAIAATLVFVSAPLIASFYRTPHLANLVRLMAVSFLISGVGLVHQALLAKDMRFRVIAIIETGAAIVASASAITAALMGAGAYSLVAQILIASMCTTVGVWIANSWRPTLSFSLADLRSLRRFSSNLVGFNFVNYLARNADYLLIGRYLGAVSLGYYTLGYNFLLLPLQLLTYVIARVTFPAYSMIQDDVARIARAYLRAASLIATLTFPLMLGVVVTSGLFVDCIYGPRWSPAVPVIMVLAPVGMVQSIVALNGSVYQSQSRTDVQLRVGAFFSVAALASFWIGLHWGIVGVSAAYAAVTVAFTPYPLLAKPLGLLGVRYRDLVREVRVPFIASVTMFVCLRALRPAMTMQLGRYTALATLIVLGFLLYAALDKALGGRLSEIWRLLLHDEGKRLVARPVHDG